MQTQTTRQIEAIAARMSDEMIRYQVRAHEKHDDYSESFFVYLKEYNKRGLRESHDWQDEGEIRMGA